LIVDCQRTALTDCYSTLVFDFVQALPLKESAAHSSRTLLRGGYQIPVVLEKEPRQSKSFSSRKNSFALPLLKIGASLVQ